jgi:hypothetical protein
MGELSTWKGEKAYVRGNKKKGTKETDLLSGTG